MIAKKTNIERREVDPSVRLESFRIRVEIDPMMKFIDKEVR